MGSARTMAWTNTKVLSFEIQILKKILRENDETGIVPEDAFSFGRLMIFMFSNWYLAWILRLFPMCQVKR